MTYIRECAIKNAKYLVTTHTSAQTTSDSANTFVTISGSEIAYAPSNDASKVIYEISFYAEKIDGKFFQCIQLEEYDGSSWSEINAKFRKNIGVATGETNQNNRYYIYFRYVIPTWSGSKQLRLRTSDRDPNQSVSLHQLTEWDGASATDQFCNTNLLVYSI